MAKHIDIDRVRRYMQAHIREIERVEDVASGLGIPAMALRKAFRRACDEHLWVHLLWLRSEAARQEIIRGLDQAQPPAPGDLEDALGRYVAFLPEPDATWPETVNRLLEAVHGNLFVTYRTAEGEERGFLVDDFRRISGVRYPISTARFRTLVGEPVIHYIHRHRAGIARELLAHTDLPVHDIAYALGYTARSTFNTAFKRAMGQPPGGLRE